MKLILSRHGNTFEPGDRVVWIGRRTDLPLAEAGCRQAQQLGKVLRQADLRLNELYCGPLRRTRQYADIVAEQIGGPLRPIVEPSLAEIDYGAWEGLSSQEIVAQFGAEELEAWERNSTWPLSPRWSPAEAKLTADITTFVEHLSQRQGKSDVVLAITSNGVLRYFLRFAKNSAEVNMEGQGGKVATGHICLLDVQPRNCRVHTWNVAPNPDFLSELNGVRRRARD